MKTDWPFAALQVSRLCKSLCYGITLDEEKLVEVKTDNPDRKGWQKREHVIFGFRSFMTNTKDAEHRTTQLFLAFAFGVVFLGIILCIAFIVPNPTVFQYQVFRITLALAAGGVAAMIPGILNVRLPNFLTAGGALALFVVVYFYSPAQIAIQTLRSDPSKLAIQPKVRINAFPDDKLKEEGMFVGVKEVLIFEADHEGEQRISFSIRGIDKPAELLFDSIAPNYPFALAVHFPAYRRTAYFDVSEHFPQAFEDDSVKQDWRIHATIYDIDNDGIPEVLVALNRWEGDFWDVFSSVTLLVYTFHLPTSVADLDRSENWAFAGKATGQQVILLDEDRIIMPIGSRTGTLYLLKDDLLIEAGGVVRDNNGRYRADR